MSADEPSTSGCNDAGADGEQEPFLKHQARLLTVVCKVNKLDNLAGLAVKYHVTVSDIKRANGLLSDSAMYAKDTLLIPTRSIPCGLEYSTWAGMIVAQYGRIPGSMARPGGTLVFGGHSPPKHSAALDQLQRYYGTGDTASEPSSFRPGENGSSIFRTASGIEIELMDVDSWRGGGGQEEGEEACDVQYAGSQAGPSVDERLRRRRANESAGSLGDGADVSEPDLAHLQPQGSWDMGLQQEDVNARRPLHHARARSQNSTPISPGRSSGRRKESILERLKRVASQPALAGPSAPSLARMADAAISSISIPPDANLPPRPPGVGALQKAVAAVQLKRDSKESAKKE